MDTSIDDPERAQADVQFVSKISEKMHVPRHIRLGNDTGDIGGERHANGVRFADAMMTVPDRILVAGDNEQRAGRLSPNEILANDGFNADRHVRNLPVTLQTPPSTLTVRNGIYRTAVDELEERLNPKRFRRDLEMLDSSTQDSTEIANPKSPLSLNPDQKLVLLEKQVTRLNTRLYQLEDELESVQYWQKVMTCLGVTLVAVLFLKSVVNR